MSIGRRHVLLLLYLMLAAWSTEATKIAVRSQSRQSRKAGSAQEAVAEGASDRTDDEDDDDDDGQDTGDDTEEVSKAGVFSKVGGAQLASAAVTAASATAPVNAKDKAALVKNKREQAELRRELAHLSDVSKSHKEVYAAAKLVANQTESAALGKMLAHMWSDMRLFELPSYSRRAQEKLHQLEKEQLALEADLAGVSKQKEQENGVEQMEEDVSSASREAKTMSVSEAYVSTNFWKMNSKQRETFAAGTVVYLAFGILLGLLYDQVRGLKMLLPAPRDDIPRNSRELSFSIVGCLGAPSVCVMGFCCPVMRWADSMDRYGFLSYWVAFLAFLLLTSLYSYTWGVAYGVVVAMGVFYRQQLRKSRDIENGTLRSVICDVLAWSICQPCAIIQEARQESILIDAMP